WACLPRRQLTHVLLHANSYLKDNRIPPEGFTNNQASVIEPQALPAGIGTDADFNRLNNQEGSGTDTVHYRVPLNDPGVDHSVEVRLLFQSVQPAFIEGLHATGTEVTGFKQMVAQNAPGFEELASANNAILAAAGGAAGGVAASGGGCTIGKHRAVDPVLPAMALIALGYLGLRRRGRGQC
ncbi:MAG: JDVT-CTERM domain-containing protein, partial [Gammaproteobacteria bacterium]